MGHAAANHVREVGDHRTELAEQPRRELGRIRGFEQQHPIAGEGQDGECGGLSVGLLQQIGKVGLVGTDGGRAGKGDLPQGVGGRQAAEAVLAAGDRLEQGQTPGIRRACAHSFLAPPDRGGGQIASRHDRFQEAAARLRGVERMAE